MRLALLGDIALFGRCKTPDYYKSIGEYLSSFDYVVGNLETPFSVKKKTYGAKSAYLYADVECITILKQLHINAVTLANNHMFDYGKEGYETTKHILRDNGIEYFGSEGRDLLIEKDGNKIAFTGCCCYTTNPLKCVKYGEYGVNAYNLEKVQEIIKQYSCQGFLNIVAIHAGLEHVNYPSISHVRAARKLSEVTPYVYYGHHPHVIQGVEECEGSLIAHSLGNFCFDDVYTDNSNKPLVALTDNNRTGMVLELTIEGSKLVSWKEQVFYISPEDGPRLMDHSDSLSDYNNSLIMCEKERESYTSKRNCILARRITERKKERDIVWYIKRLRPRYVRTYLNARKNNKLFCNNVIKYLK